MNSHNCQVHDLVSVLLNSRVLLGSHPAKPARGPAPKAEALHLRRLRRNLSLKFANRFRAETVTRRATYSGVPDRSALDLLGWSVEAEEQAAAGRRPCPEAVTE